MPESPDIDTDKLREAVQEELGREGGGFLRRIALTTAVLAAVAAIAALKAGSTANEALVLKTEATRLQAEASDQWAYYQAKGIKLAVAQATEAPWRSLGKRAPADLLEKERRYAAVKFFLYTMAGSALMFVGILALVFLHAQATGRLTFDVVTLEKDGATREFRSDHLAFHRYVEGLMEDFGLSYS